MSDNLQALDLSVVAPVRDERENLEPLVEELLAVLRPLELAFEILLVDDGSRDGSHEVIARLAETRPEVRALRLSAPSGQTAAFDAGFRAARGRHVVTIDADLQYDPNDIPRLLEWLDRFPVVIGHRSHRRDNPLRRLSSAVARFAYHAVCGDRFSDTGCSLKAFRCECLSDLKLHDGMHRFLPTLLRLEGYEVAEVEVRHRPRGSGHSKYGVWNRIFRASADLLAVRWMKKRNLNYEVVRDEP